MTYLGGVPCDIAPGMSTNSCNSPNEADWYPNLTKKLGAPLGNYTVNGNIYTREFEYASVYLDLDSQPATYVSFAQEQESDKFIN